MQADGRLAVPWTFTLLCAAFAARPALGADDPAPPGPAAPPAQDAGSRAPAQTADPKAPAQSPAAAQTSPTAVRPPAAPASPATQAATAAAAETSDLRSAIESALGAPVHGDLTIRYLARFTSDVADQDLYQFLNLRVGDETKDRLSATFSVRAAEDLDRAHSDEPGFVFRSLDDTHEGTVNALLYTAYATVRPERGPFETLRLGRQYVYAAETFHVDGVSATTFPLAGTLGLRVTAYGGVPVHFYESGSSGDWLAGVRVAADPWKGGRAAIDYARVQDELSTLGSEERNDFGAVSAWQRIGPNVELHGKFGWLDGPRDATFRATATFPEEDLLVQFAYYRLVEEKQEFATEFDPYSEVLLDLERYQQFDLRASKGLGDHLDVEIGGMLRELLPGEEETPFNRNTRRIWVTPTLSGLPWPGTSVSVTAESVTGDGERVQTWGASVSHEFAKRFEASAGTDYSLYDFGPLSGDERVHVRTAWARARFALTDAVSADVRYGWERDDEETFHALTLALVLQF